jgi:hypothetical protein
MRNFFSNKTPIALVFFFLGFASSDMLKASHTQFNNTPDLEEQQTEEQPTDDIFGEQEEMEALNYVNQQTQILTEAARYHQHVPDTVAVLDFFVI